MRLISPQLQGYSHYIYDGSVDPENQHRYQKKLEEWQDVQKRFVKTNGDVLKRRYENEAIHGIGPIDNADTRRAVESMKREVEFENTRVYGSTLNQPRKNNLTYTIKK